jgi:hypothetical protein
MAMPKARFVHKVYKSDDEVVRANVSYDDAPKVEHSV